MVDARSALPFWLKGAPATLLPYFCCHGRGLLLVVPRGRVGAKGGGL